ncbi:hypothetical protein V5O48_011779 [Marasmius crinis-equi]|uniref:Survival Motor Neuron Gemin2-binding domain-containing protein n=1 Tax=Marasmius crinis-equi TaxID=585013 RepID=A0ABR3F4M6_9AGAR
MRQVVSYEDITLPYEVTANAVEEASKLNTNHKSQSKKRKRKARSSNNRNHDNHQEVFGEGQYEEEDMEMSRELTHEEIWDDSALIDAWNAATEEYEAYHGPDKGWKSEPVHKSALWYNVPPAKKAKLEDNPPTTSTLKAGKTVTGDDEDEFNSHPIDFETFVPDHDPALVKPSGVSGSEQPAFYALPEAPRAMASRDEAFSRALNAMYWSGYWTAVYHCHNYVDKPSGDREDGQEEESGNVDDEGGSVEGEDGEEEDIEIEDNVETNFTGFRGTSSSAPILGPQIPAGLPSVDDFVPTQR